MLVRRKGDMKKLNAVKRENSVFPYHLEIELRMGEPKPFSGCISVVKSLQGKNHIKPANIRINVAFNGGSSPTGYTPEKIEEYILLFQAAKHLAGTLDAMFLTRADFKKEIELKIAGQTVTPIFRENNDDQNQ